MLRLIFFPSERPHPVKLVNTSNVTARNLIVEWRKPFDGYNTISHYSIHLIENCNETGEVDRTVNVFEPYPTPLSSTVKDLRPYTSYCMDIQAFNDLGGSDRVLPVTLNTKAAGSFTVVRFNCNSYLYTLFVKLPDLLWTFLLPRCLQQQFLSLGLSQNNQMETSFSTLSVIDRLKATNPGHKEKK